MCFLWFCATRDIVCERCLGGCFWNCIDQKCHKNSFSASAVYTLESYFNTWFGKYDWISHFISPSRFLTAKHVAAGFPHDKLVYLPNSLEPSAFEPSFSPGAYVLFAGRLSREKGIICLLQAFSQTDIPLRIVGVGPIEVEAKEYVINNGMQNISFEGYCSGDRLKSLFQGAAFVVMPSEWYENAPMSVLEGFAYGKPIVGSRIGGIPELVIPDCTGLLFEPGNVDDLQLNIVELWGNKAKISTMGSQARARIEHEFSAQRHLSGLLEIYESAMKN